MSEAKPQDGTTVKGYRTLSKEDIAEMNSIKDLTRALVAKIDSLKGDEYDGRWLSVARTNAQLSCMAACRAVAQPDEDC